MTVLWTNKDAASATDGHSTADWQAYGVSIDSRTIKQGDLFIAITGPHMDGHKYVANAFASGAAAAAVTQQWASTLSGNTIENPLLLVSDTMVALEALARVARERCSAQVVAITGSAGKTGTKDTLTMALAKQGRTSATAGNLNNQWGLPLSLARMPVDSEFGIFEMGMNHTGEIAHLAALARPHLAVITNVEAAHLAFFNSEQDIAIAKAEIFQGLDRGGEVLLNCDNRHFQHLQLLAERRGITKIYGFGSQKTAEFRLLDCKLTASGSDVRVSVMGDIFEYRVGTPGRHWVQNSLAVIGCAYLLGADPSAAAATMVEAQPTKGRGQHHIVQLGGGSFELIDESYNANPASMRAAFGVLATTSPHVGGRRIAVLGDMLELGNTAPDLHRNLAADLLACNVDLVFLAGKHMEELSNTLPIGMVGAHTDTSMALVDLVKGALEPGDVVMVKGSLGSSMSLIVDALLARDYCSTRPNHQATESCS